MIYDLPRYIIIFTFKNVIDSRLTGPGKLGLSIGLFHTGLELQILKGTHFKAILKGQLRAPRPLHFKK